MVKINNKEEFEDFYPYSKDQIENYPKEYPCVCTIEEIDGGLMGDYKQVYVTYFPKGLISEEDFLAGINIKWENL